VDGDDLESMVIRGEDIMLLFVTSLVRTSLIHTFLTKSRSVTKPIGMITPLDFTKYNEYTRDGEHKDAIEEILEYYI
ncbi:MAG: hypothetical protein WBX29_06445, partial [Nitrososphaeraceae archaeon]